MIRLTEMISRSLFFEDKKLRVLDFDDTLVKTTSYIYVTHKSGKISKLTPGAYAVYKPRKGDEFDYREFKSKNEPVEIKQMTDKLRRMVRDQVGKGIYILTARSVYKPIIKYLTDIGINSKKLYVIALNSNDPNDKVAWVKKMIKTRGFDDVFFADDSKKNIDAMNKMLRTQNVKWKTKHVKY